MAEKPEQTRIVLPELAVDAVEAYLRGEGPMPLLPLSAAEPFVKPAVDRIRESGGLDRDGIHRLRKLGEDMRENQEIPELEELYGNLLIPDDSVVPETPER